MRMPQEIHELLKDPHVVSIMLTPKEFLALFYDLYFLRTSWNTGVLYNKIIECPDLTETDVDRWTKKCVDELKKIVREW